MADFIFLIHAPPKSSAPEANWAPYLEKLQAGGHLRGGSAIGDGACFNKKTDAPAITAHLSGFIRVDVADLDAAKALLPGNPVYEAGGTVEIRELPRTD